MKMAGICGTSACTCYGAKPNALMNRFIVPSSANRTFAIAETEDDGITNGSSNANKSRSPARDRRS